MHRRAIAIEDSFNVPQVGIERIGVFRANPITAVVAVGFPHDARMAAMLEANVNVTVAREEAATLHLRDVGNLLKQAGYGTRADVGVFNFKGNESAIG